MMQAAFLDLLVRNHCPVSDSFIRYDASIMGCETAND